MSDKELLELAAEAAGILKHAGPYETNDEGVMTYQGRWNPLTDDGDALRLSVKLKIDLCIYNGGVEAVWIDEDISETYRLREHADEEFEGMAAKLSATRRAIVRAAAEIGKAIP